jgi:sterol desaturase/sphingolipid hydroxylase (fatty acid hydroxylase superfamily)
MVELVLRLPFHAVVSEASQTAAKAVRILAADRVSDHWKERAISAYARIMFASSIKLAGLLAVLLLLVGVLIWMFERLSDGFAEFLLGWQGLVFSVAFATVYYLARRLITRGL